MRIYVAAPFEMRDAAVVVMAQLEARGHVVTSTWLKEDSLFEETHEWAWQDLCDVRDAELLLAINPEEFRRIGTGGRHVELGYALAFGKQVVLLGARTNIFHKLNWVRVISSVDEL